MPSLASLRGGGFNLWRSPLTPMAKSKKNRKKEPHDNYFPSSLYKGSLIMMLQGTLLNTQQMLKVLQRLPLNDEEKALAMGAPCDAPAFDFDRFKYWMEIVLRLAAESCTESQRREYVKSLQQWALNLEDKDEALNFAGNPQSN
jgi:hypothetical protein